MVRRADLLGGALKGRKYSHGGPRKCEFRAQRGRRLQRCCAIAGELLAFERLLSDLSARFANVAVDQVVAEIEAALDAAPKFLGFDRSAFAEVVDGDRQCILVGSCGRREGLRGPIPAHFNWFTGQLLSGHTVVIRHTKTSRQRKPPQPNTIVALVFAPSFVAAVGGRVVATVGFGAFRSTREWPDEFMRA